MRRILLLLLTVPLMFLGEAFASLLVVSLLFGGILTIGVVVGHHVFYTQATVLAIAWAVLVLCFRDRLEKWFD